MREQAEERSPKVWGNQGVMKENHGWQTCPPVFSRGEASAAPRARREGVTLVWNYEETMWMVDGRSGCLFPRFPRDCSAMDFGGYRP